MRLYRKIWDEKTWTIYCCVRAWRQSVISPDWVMLHLSLILDGDTNVFSNSDYPISWESAHETLIWLRSPRSRRTREKIFNKIGFVRLVNPKTSDGLWAFQGKRINWYAHVEMEEDRAFRIADKMCGKEK